MYGRKRDWLTELQKEKAKVPSPDKYETAGNAVTKKNIAMNKSTR